MDTFNFYVRVLTHSGEVEKFFSSYRNRLWSKTQLEKSGAKLTLYILLTTSATLREERSQNHEKLQLP